MSITLKSVRVERLVRETAELAHESMTEAVGRAVEERLQRLRGRRTAPDRFDAIMQVSRRCAGLRDLDSRSADEILGYGEEGAPGGR